MNAERRRAYRPEPPKPPLMIRVDLYLSYVWYEFKRHWSMRLIGIGGLAAVLAMFIWVMQVRMPILESYAISPPTLSDIQAENEKLKHELQQLTTHASNAVFAQTNRKLLDGYAGLSQLIEASGDHAAKLGLLMQYELGQPVQQGGSISDVFLVDINFTFLPAPEIAMPQIWENMMRQSQWMLENKDMYQLQSSRMVGDGRRVLSMQLGMQVRLSQNHILFIKAAS